MTQAEKLDLSFPAVKAEFSTCLAQSNSPPLALEI